MYKKLLLAISFALSMQALAFAGSITAPAGTTFTFKPSANVTYDYYNDGATKPQGYTVATKHFSGDRLFAGTSKSSNIFFKEAEADKGKSVTEASTKISANLDYDDASFTANGWRSQ